MYLTQGLHRAVQRTPGRPATIFGDRVRTWAESGERVARLAAALKAVGVRTDDRVGILAHNSDIYHEYLLAVPWADAIMNPVNTRWSVAEIGYSLRDCDTQVLLVDDAFTSIVPQLHDVVPLLRTVIHIGSGPVPEGALSMEVLIAKYDPVPDARRGGNALAGIFYTGGTTGRSKGVMLSHANILASAFGMEATRQRVPGGSLSGGRVLHVAPMFHIAGCAPWTESMTLGRTHVYVPRFTPAGVAKAIEQYDVTDTLLVPTMIQLLVDSEDTADADLSSLQRLTYSASPISESVLQRAMDRMPTTEFTQVYAMTELGPVITVLSHEDHADARLRRSVGRAAPHCEVLVVDEQDRELPRGGIGQIICRGASVMRGYWDLLAMTADVLRNDWMHTGDAGYMDEEGYVFIVDRIKDMIISGGENVYSAEVENALSSHPAVKSCAVVGLPDEDWGERVHAVIVPAGDDRPDVEILREHVKQFIAGYKAPRTVAFVDTLPLSGAGKVLKNELRARYSPQES
ncbi:long-chain-fatty-acid--CoA ligase [Pseudonocardia xinjiangensis]|uniref:long-chain-fatty-acid--CoA ligase n=1 Tax=Pseudonocardia xinjiangensis TaxID=75289 RepID=UPI003D8BC795